MEEKISLTEWFHKSNVVYQWMEDELSRSIFTEKLSWSGTKSEESVSRLVELSSPNTKVIINTHRAKLEEVKEIILYGAGELGQNFYKQFQLEERNVLFCDRNYETIGTMLGNAVISPEKLIEKAQSGEEGELLIVICAIPGYETIFRYLTENGVKAENILPFLCHDEKNIYFEDFMTFTDQEVFVDGGSYDGMNAVEFSQRCKNPRIFSFEADLENLPKIEENYKKHHITNYKIFDVGMWSEKTTLHFSGNGTVGSMIDDSGSSSISCDTLDHLLENEAVTFIKMDIEGAELEALKGAKTLIQKNKPKLAISIYHKSEDILALPLYIKSLVPEYKLYLRHYTNVETDTVLYAVL